MFFKPRYWLQIGWISKCNLCSSKRIKQRQSLLFSQKLTLQLISLSWLLSLIHDFSFYLYLNWNYGFQLKLFGIHLHSLQCKQDGLLFAIYHQFSRKQASLVLCDVCNAYYKQQGSILYTYSSFSSQNCQNVVVCCILAVAGTVC